MHAQENRTLEEVRAWTRESWLVLIGTFLLAVFVLSGSQLAGPATWKGTFALILILSLLSFIREAHDRGAHS